MSIRRWLGVGVLVTSAMTGCGGSDAKGSPDPDGSVDGGGSGNGNGGGDGGNANGSTGDNTGSANANTGSTADFEVTPSAMQTLRVDNSASPPSLTFTATRNGAPLSSVGWSVDRGDLGSVTAGDDGTAVFTPSGLSGGLVTVRATLNGQVLEREVWIELVAQQNGPSGATTDAQQIPADVSELTSGGGVGGVGGEGLGGAVDDDDLRALLDAPTGDGQAQQLELLYPYDATVWPRGLLAPLVMWRSDLGGVDAIKLELRTRSGSFEWSGTFSAPAILAQTGGDFIRHPIPQDVWEMATNTAGGRAPDGTADTLELRLTVAKDDAAYGPLSQTWTVAPGRLSGTIYYSSYGTNLAKNHGGAVGGDGQFGGAVLSIRVGDTGPRLVAGTDGDDGECRVCHSVSADGGRLFAMPGDYDGGFAYTLSPSGAVEEAIDHDNVSYPGLTRDGRYALSPDATLLDLDNAGATVDTSGLTEVATNVGTPSFSYDSTQVAFNPMASSSLDNPTQKLVVMDFDVGAMAFANALTVVDGSGAPAQERPGWPSFTPNGALIYQQQTKAGIGETGQGALHTRRGAASYLAWTPLDNPMPTPLNRLNGLDENGDSYLPKLASPTPLRCRADGHEVGGVDGSGDPVTSIDADADHALDHLHNYEPTVNPVASGGYAWVVFTSRRMYGSVADIPPYCSDPRGVDLIENITTKKLWVAAIDLNAENAIDISYPAFYLPAQELLAGNTRGSWVLDPCRADGESCETGDMCCNGFCAADGEGGLMCADAPPEGECSGLQERCEDVSDCCDPTNDCINGFCSFIIL